MSPYIEEGMPIYADEWQKLKYALGRCRDVLQLLKSNEPRNRSNSAIYDHFDDFPNSNYWNIQCSYSQDVWVGSSLLVVPQFNYIYLSRQANIRMPFRIAIWTRNIYNSRTNTAIELKWHQSSNPNNYLYFRIETSKDGYNYDRFIIQFMKGLRGQIFTFPYRGGEIFYVDIYDTYFNFWRFTIRNGFFTYYGLNTGLLRFSYEGEYDIFTYSHTVNDVVGSIILIDAIASYNF